VVVGMVVLLGARRAEAQREPDELELSYLWDGGAVPLIWLPALGTFAVDRWMEAPDQPLWFSPKEGGALSQQHAELPGEVITAGGLALGATILLDADSSRWFHLKGLVGSVVTTGFLTAVGKRTFGRHRPDYAGEGGIEDGRRSFPSGHASGGLAIVTYAALYLGAHGFDRWREPGTLPWWEIASYGVLAAVAVSIPAERVVHKRHHPTDVIAGSLLGASTSIANFLWQEYRYRRATGVREVTGRSFQLAPMVDRIGMELTVRF
jgi:hypothetical protein